MELFKCKKIVFKKVKKVAKEKNSLITTFT